MILLAAIAATAGLPRAEALPVIPGQAGYGVETKAGRGGTVYRVTSLAESGTGTLKACIDKTGPRVCVFEVSGTIRLTQDLIVRNSYMTIAGQTAPSPGIMLRGAALRIQASDILVQHLRVRAGDDASGPSPSNRDSLKIEGSSSKPVRNIVIDHCSFSWAVDETASTWGPHTNITFSNNIFAEPLNQSIHPQKDGSGTEPHGYGVLLGPSDASITMYNNLLAHQVERNPLSRVYKLVFVNNVVYNRGTMDVDLQSEDHRRTYNTIIGNVFLRGPSYSRATSPIYVRTSGTYSLGSGSRVYQKDNYAPGSTTGSVFQFTGSVLSGLITTAPTAWNPGLVVRGTANNSVLNWVLANAGARPADRDSVDKRVVSHVKNRNGIIINCVSANGSSRCARNAGGWPSLAVRTRKLTLPANASSTASNGYTNLENWLNSMDRSLAGVAQAASPTSPPALSVR